jgi:predicted DsbA family dithiol-disulfide isomerase
MIEGRNIARREVLLEVAAHLADECPDVLAVEPFLQALDGGEAARALRDDLREVRYRDITRYPTLILRRPEGPGVMIVGYRPYEALQTALLQVVPDLRPVRALPDADTYVTFWGGATERELAELKETPPVPVDQP